MTEDSSQNHSPSPASSPQRGPLPTIHDLPDSAVKGQPVFLRVDFNVPMDGDRVVDGTRIDSALPTLLALLDRGANCVLASHRGRPTGKPDPDLSLEPVATELQKRLEAERSGVEVRFCADCVGEAAEQAVADLADENLEGGGVLLLENLRFHAGEKANDPDFVAQLARLSKVYVNDAFGTAHRAHASTVGLAERAEHRAAGLLLHKEVAVLSGLLENPKRPFLAILGGAKISGKLETMRHLAETVDALAVGGGMANTLLAARGEVMGKSLVEDDMIETARSILARCEERGVALLLPEDLVVTKNLDGEQPAPPIVRVLTAENGAGTNEIQGEEMAVDIGPLARETFKAAIAEASTVFWNGPLGVFEVPPYDQGSVAVAEALGDCEGFSAVGGGETVAAIKAAGAEDGIDHISTGGGASLELLAGEELPGVEVLRGSKAPAGAAGNSANQQTGESA